MGLLLVAISCLSCSSFSSTLTQVYGSLNELSSTRLLLPTIPPLSLPSSSANIRAPRASLSQIPSTSSTDGARDVEDDYQKPKSIFEMALENGYTFRSPVFPAPPHADSNQTPSRSASRESSRRDSPSPYPSSSPPTMPPEREHHFHKQRGSQDITNDEHISALDPRKFTPNLHASLVSEILSLRREIETKDSVVVSLEEGLHKTKAENVRLNETIKVHVKDTRAAKRHVQALESGTLTALGDLAKERDTAVENLADIRKRLEASQSKIRSQDEEVKRSHALWDQDRQNWDNDKRNLERKVHIVEGRLKTMIAEVAAVQANGHYQPGTYNNNNPPDDVSDVQEILRSRWSDTISTRDTISTTRTNSIKTRSRGMSTNTNDGSERQSLEHLTSNRFSGFGGTKVNGLSLAEELEINEEEEDDLVENDLDSGHVSPNALPEEAFFKPRRSSESQSRDQKARKLLGLGDGRETPVQEVLPRGESMSVSKEVFGLSEEKEYKDGATQFSPPPSPKAEESQTEISTEKTIEQPEHAANQRRKRVSIPIEQTHPARTGARAIMPMVSAACQTVTQPASPPLTPIIAIETSPPALTLEERLANMVSSSTQTDQEELPAFTAAGTSENLPTMTIPVIAIHPPGSRPPSSHTSVVLPPRTKNVSCQASIELPRYTTSISVQTEPDAEVRLGNPFQGLPASASSSKRISESQSDIEARQSPRSLAAPRRAVRRNLRRPPPVEPSRVRRRPPSIKTKDPYPGNNDDGPLRKDQGEDLRRPVRSGSLFAGFDGPSEGNASKNADIDFSDDDLATREPIRKTLTKVQDSWKLIPQPADSLQEQLESAHHKTLQSIEQPTRAAPPIPESPSVARPIVNDKAAKKPSLPSASSKSNDVRRAALISSGTAAHTLRTGSPTASTANSQDSNAPAPPFPVPTRSSSRRIPISASDGARSPTPDSTSFFSSHHNRGPMRPSANNPLRKVQSATTVARFSRNHGRRSPSRSPPPMSASSVETKSPQLPRMPRNDITARRPSAPQQVRQRSNTASSILTASELPSDYPNQPTSVVDAIAQTMVGGWMWKYVRKRKSFGITESPQAEFEAGRNSSDIGSSNGLRHKRWVWLAPYERAVLWSNKQPTTGHALMGKSGRKRKQYWSNVQIHL